MSRFVENVREAFSTSSEPDRAAQGLVPLVLIVAGLAAVAVLAVSWIGSSILWKANVEAKCIAQPQNSAYSDNRCLDEDQTGSEIISNQINTTKSDRF